VGKLVVEKDTEGDAVVMVLAEEAKDAPLVVVSNDGCGP